ncbi:family 78 glycoside hydrolase catalytic domain [Microbacterium sp.]|uniref:alpha-L-rhamnosidase n=1 Tax=Microbacterium sp. TaxID=51671 RepID=UPI003A8CB19C
MTAIMISPAEVALAAPLLRTAFSLDHGHGKVIRATLSLSALGIVEAWLNGEPTSDELLAPGWTSYEWRIRLVEHDVTALVTSQNALVLRVGHGWYSGHLGFTGQREVYGHERAAYADLRIEFEDGHAQHIVTDESWRSSTGEVLADDLYNGETIDARLRDDQCTRPGFDDTSWGGVRAVPFDTELLESRVSEPVRRVGELSAQRTWTSPAGKTLVDFGQNLVGFVRLRIRGERGSEVVLRHAEVLEDDELGTRPLRAAEATDRFILSGSDDVFEPTLTFHGFRYVEVSGWPGEVDHDALTAIVVASDLRPIGTFSCSDPLLNRLHENVRWGMRGNFLSVPTDCPQRDERLGWTGDLAVFASTAAYLCDVDDFLCDWLTDMELERSATPEHTVPVVVPNVMKYLDTGFPEPGATAVWGDAAAWVPWALWRAYGNEDSLRTAYPLMAAHARSVARALSPTGLWDTGFQFGDWLDPDAPADDPGRSKADTGVVATASAFRTASILAHAAEALGDLAGASEFAAMRERVGAAFRTHYVDGSGVILSDSATVYALAIVFGILEGPEADSAGDRLAELVRAADYRVSTGFAGTPFILDALSDTGHLDEAYGLLLEREMPSWLYPVTMGATTIWERWDSMLPDGTINPGEMTSFNHYAFGAVADWMHRRIGGIEPLEPGYRRILIAPQPGGDLTWADASLQTPHGLVRVRWDADDAAGLTAEVTVPEGTEAVLRLPGRNEEIIGAGTHRR